MIVPKLSSIKLFSTFVVLLCVLGASATSASAALEYEFNSGKFTDTSSEIKLMNEAGTETVGQIKCDETVYTLNTKGKSATVKVTPSFAGCNTTIEKEGKEISTKVTNECKEGLQLNQPEELGEEPGHGLYRSSVDLLSGCKIVLSPALKSACEIKIEGAQKQLKYAYYNAISQIKLGEPETIFELGKVTDKASGAGCGGAGLPATAVAQVQGGRAPAFLPADGNYGGVNGYKPILKNIGGGGTRLTQEFEWSGGGRVVCEEAEYESDSFLPNSVYFAVYVKPVLNMCKIREGGTEPVATVTIPPTCKFRLGEILGVGLNHTGNFQIPGVCNEIKFASNSTMCKLKLTNVAQRTIVKYKNAAPPMGRGEIEVTFEVGGLASGNIENCPNVTGTQVKYTGTMIFKEVYIQP